MSSNGLKWINLIRFRKGKKEYIFNSLPGERINRGKTSISVNPARALVLFGKRITSHTLLTPISYHYSCFLVRNRVGYCPMAPFEALEQDYPLIDSAFRIFCASHAIFTGPVCLSYFFSLFCTILLLFHHVRIRICVRLLEREIGFGKWICSEGI